MWYSQLLSLLGFAILFSPTARAYIGPDGQCSTIGVIPFTNNGRDHPVSNEIGYSQLAALTLAIKHFNDRDSTVVRELRRLSRDICNVTLENPLNIDSQNGGHNAATVMIDILRNDSDGTFRNPCAGELIFSSDFFSPREHQPR